MNRKLRLSLLSLITVLCSTLSAQTAKTVEREANGDSIQASFFDYCCETFANGIGVFSISDTSKGELSYVWNYDSDNRVMKASARADGKSHAAESWLVSPWIELAATEQIRFLRFDQRIDNNFGKLEEEATVWMRLQGEDWVQLPITYPEMTDGEAKSAFHRQTIEIGDCGCILQIGFKYTSTANAAGTWEIRNFSIDDDAMDGISAVEANKANASKAIYNLAGQRLRTMQKGINIVGGKKIVKK